MRGDVRPARRNQRWAVAEQDMLLDELRGNDTLADIAARHMRSPGALCAQAEKLLTPEHEFTSNEELWNWARSELRKGDAGTLSWAVERANAAAGSYPVLREPANWTENPDLPFDIDEADGWTPAWTRPAGPERRDEILLTWSSITGRAIDRGHGQQPSPHVLDVLAGVDAARLQEAARGVVRSRGELDFASWVTECDWPGIEDLTLSAEQIRTGDDAVQRVGVELLRAGIARSGGRDRTIMRMRLGLLGEPMTLEALGERFRVSRERIRQIQNEVLRRAEVTDDRTVRRSWHHVHDALRAALRTSGDPAAETTVGTALDPELVLSFIELVMPAAPRDVAVKLVATLCGLEPDACTSLVASVNERHVERARRHQQRLREEKKRGQLTLKVRRLLENAQWPVHHDGPAGGRADPLRGPIAPGRRSNPGSWWSRRLGREIGYDSEAELHIIQLLELSDDLISSYCEQPIALSYTLYGERHDYHPDLLADISDGRRLLIEVKSRLDDFALYENVVKFEAAREFCQLLGWGFVAITDRMQTPDDLAARHVDHHVEELLTNHVTAGPTDWRQLYPVVRKHNILYVDIATLALRNGWYWHTRPFRLSTTPLDGQLRWKPVQRR